MLAVLRIWPLGGRIGDTQRRRNDFEFNKPVAGQLFEPITRYHSGSIHGHLLGKTYWHFNLAARWLVKAHLNHVMVPALPLLHSWATNAGCAPGRRP